MRYITTAILIVLLSRLIISCQANREDPYSYKASFQFIKHQIVVSLQVNETEALNFLFDTGADPSVIDLNTAFSTGIYIDTTQHGEASGRGNGRTLIYPARMDSILFWGMKSYGVETVAADLSRLSKSLGIPLHGILGYSFLRDKLFTIDYATRNIYFFNDSARLNKSLSPKTMRTKFIQDGEDMIPVVNDFSINGIPFRASIDCGSSLEVEIFSHYVSSLGIDTSTSFQSHIIGANDKQDVKKLRLAAIHLGKEEFRGIDLTVSEIKDTTQWRMGNVGNRFLKHFKVSFNYPLKEIYFERPDDSHENKANQ